MSLLSAVLQEADKACSEEIKKQCDVIIPSIKDLSERIQFLTFDLHQYFIDLFVNYSPTKSLERLNYINRKANILTEYSEVTQKVENLYQKYGVEVERFLLQCKELNKSMKLLKELFIIVEAKGVLEKAEHKFRRYNQSEAIASVNDLQKQLNNLKFGEELEKGLLTLKAQTQNQLSVYIALVSTEWENIFKWNEKKGVLYHTFCLSVQQSDPLLIQRVLKTLYSSERLNAELSKFSHFLIDKLLHNIIRHNCEIYTEDRLGALEFNIKINLKDKNSPNYQTIFTNLTAVFEFLDTTLGSQFECDKKFIEVLADSIREKFFNKIIDDCIKLNLPSCNITYESYKNIVTELDCFNKFLIDIRFVEAEKSPLKKYIDDADCVLYNKKCGKLLLEVRSSLDESLFSSKITVGDTGRDVNESIDVTEEFTWDLNKPIFLPKCTISQSVKRIMSLIVEYLEESLKLPEKYQKQLVLTIKDIAVMYQTLVPAKFKYELESCPWAIALFFNNCFYLAHGLVGPPWKTMLPIELADMLMTVLLESIQDLRVLALKTITLFLQKKKTMISESIAEKDNTEEGPWTEKNFETFDIAVNNALCFLSTLKVYWLGTLPCRMYEMALSTLIQALCQSIITRVFEGHHISESICCMLEQRLENINSSISSYFSSPKELIAGKINAWVKFSKLQLLMKAQLQETVNLWYHDKEIQEHYTCEEIRKIIKMRFQDTPYRLQILQGIQ